jgi:hypothetical protein
MQDRAAQGSRGFRVLGLRTRDPEGLGFRFKFKDQRSRGTEGGRQRRRAREAERGCERVCAAHLNKRPSFTLAIATHELAMARV